MAAVMPPLNFLARDGFNFFPKKRGIVLTFNGRGKTPISFKDKNAVLHRLRFFCFVRLMTRHFTDGFVCEVRF